VLTRNPAGAPQLWSRRSMIPHTTWPFREAPLLR